MSVYTPGDWEVVEHPGSLVVAVKPQMRVRHTTLARINWTLSQAQWAAAPGPIEARANAYAMAAAPVLVAALRGLLRFVTTSGVIETGTRDVAAAKAALDRVEGRS